MSDIPDTLYTVRQVCNMWHCDDGVVYRLIKSGKLRAFKLGVGWRISGRAMAECVALLEQGGNDT